MLGHVYILLLEANLAVQALETGLALANDIGSAWWVGNMTAYLARAYLLQGALPRSEAVLQAVMARSQQPTNSPERRICWAWGELALASDEAEMALSIADQLLASAPGASRTQPIPWLLKLKGEALGALSRREEAIQALEEARQGALARQEQPLLWQIHRALGRQHQRLKQEDLAQRNFTSARQGIASLASTIDDAYLREHFLHAALSTLPREKPVSAKPPCQRSLWRAHGARARGRAARCPGQIQPRDCRCAGGDQKNCRNTYQQHPVQAQPYLACTDRRVGCRKRYGDRLTWLIGLSTEAMCFSAHAVLCASFSVSLRASSSLSPCALLQYLHVCHDGKTALFRYTTGNDRKSRRIPVAQQSILFCRS